MSKWAERRKKLEAESDYDPLTSIPMMELGDFDIRLARRRITKEFDSSNAKNIVIIDPYLVEGDIDTILDLFATQSGRSITVITFLSRVDAGQGQSPQKLEAAKTLKRIADDIQDKGIFDSFQIIKTGFEFHDRFFLCVDEDKDGLVIASGGSLSMLLSKYSGLIRVNNKTFKRSLMRFVFRAKNEGSSLADFIEEQS